MKTPDWYRRLRVLEQRIDNQSTDIARLWNWVPQMPEQPGNSMPQLVPGTTSPPSTTTSTSTSSTTTTGTTTTSTTTTMPPLTCRNGWPRTVTLTALGFTGDSFWMNEHSGYIGVNGTHVLQHYICGSLVDEAGLGAGRWITYVGPYFQGPGLSNTGIRWNLNAYLRDSDRHSTSGIVGDMIEFDGIAIQAHVSAAFGTAIAFAYPQDIGGDGAGSPVIPGPLFPRSPTGASVLCGRNFTMMPREGVTFNTDAWYTWPSSFPLQFSSTPYYG